MTTKETTMTETKTTTPNITEKSLQLFIAFAGDAANWNGTPLVSLTAAQRGNLVQLKKAGLVRTFESDGQTWLAFTALGYTFGCEQSESFKRCYANWPQGLNSFTEEEMPAPFAPVGPGPIVPAGLQGKDAKALATIINTAVSVNGLDKSWGVTSNPMIQAEDHLHHIDQMCNEFGLTVGPDGTLSKPDKDEAAREAVAGGMSAEECRVAAQSARTRGDEETAKEWDILAGLRTAPGLGEEGHDPMADFEAENPTEVAPDSDAVVFARKVQEWSGPGVTHQHITDLVFAFSRDTELWEEFKGLVQESRSEHEAEMRESTRS